MQIKLSTINEMPITHVKISQLVNKMCSQTELNNLVASCQQAVDNLSTTRWEEAVENILFTSCWNSIATSLLQVCYNLCVFTCVYTVLCSLLNWRQLSMYIVQWSVPVDVTIATVTIECIHWNPTWRPKQGVKCQHDEIKSKM
jgi:hypothetical protein